MEITEDRAIYDAVVELVRDVMGSVQCSYDKQHADNYIIRVKNAEVLWYQPMKLIACVRFLEDKNNNEYHLYNRCGAFLAPGDQVKVYYTTNEAKGWIAVRNGAPNYMNEYGQYIHDIRNCCDEDDEINKNNCCCVNPCCPNAETSGKDSETVENGGGE